ncbi:phasin family protein [Noviherbaspirillum humi]|uniref:Phasin family protein n=2 Tax=Noviherbaspirillum humi TaxID=1688639 RepID=A0A239HG20_9BURK|nr:phasin family protein [Noviherbaspirillum humi]
MLRFSQPVTPAILAHIDAQYSFLKDFSEKLFDTAQKVNELNIQAASSVLEESLSNTQQVICAKNPYEALSIAAGHAQPTAEKMRAYQQHLTNIAARMQAALAQTAESHVPETSRTAAAMADDVERRAAEEAERTRQRQRAAMEAATAPSQQAPQQPQQAQPAQRAAESKSSASPRAGT